MTTLEGLNPDFKDLLILLVDGDVDFVVVGAYAVAFTALPEPAVISTCSSGLPVTMPLACTAR